MAAGVSPRLEAPPGGGVGPAGVLSLGVPEAGGDCLGRLAVATGQFQGLAELRDGGQIGGHVASVKLVIRLYHEFYSPLKMPMTWLSSHLTGDVGLRGFG